MKQRIITIGTPTRGTPTRARGALFVFLLLAMGGAAHAGDCKDANNTVQMNECMAKEAKAADAKLNQTYQRVIASLQGADNEADQSYPASTKASLIDAQRAWLKYRDADCKAVYNHWRGGTIRDVMQLGCMKDRTEQRTHELEGFLQKS